MLDPRIVKQRVHLQTIQTTLADKRYTPEQKQAMERLWKYLDTRSDLAIGSKKNYIKNARRIILFIETSPSVWDAESLIRIMDNWRRKEDGSEYHPQYRNTKRTVIKYLLEAHNRNDLLQEIRFGNNKMLVQVMTDEKAPDPTDAFVEEESVVITEEHERAILSQMPDRPKVIWSCIFDAGARPDDFKQLKLSDIRWTHNGTRITLMVPEDTKTGLRPVRILKSLPILRWYLNNDHPYTDRGPDGRYLRPHVALFLNCASRPWHNTTGITYHLVQAVKKIRKIETSIERGEDIEWPFSKLPEGINARTIRVHCTKKLIKKNVRVDVAATHLGNSPDMIFRVYNRVNKRAEVESELDALVGVKREVQEDETEWVACPTCSHVNQGAQYCANCGTPLTEKAMTQQDKTEEQRYDRLIKRLLPELRKQIMGELGD